MRRTAAMLALVGLVSVVASACGGGKKASPSPVPETPATAVGVTPAPATPSPTTRTVGGLPVRAWKILPAVDLPQDSVVYVETGCFYCDGPTEALVRVSYIGNPGLATTTVETLFRDPSGVTTDGKLDIVGYALALDRSDVHVVSVNDSRGPASGLGAVPEGAESLIYVSLDAGVTWRELGRREGLWTPVSSGAEGAAFSRQFAGKQPELVNQLGEVIPVTAPVAGAEPVYDRGFGVPIWRLIDRATFVDAGGNVVFRPPPGVTSTEDGFTKLGSVARINPPNLVVRWYDGKDGYAGFVRGGKLESVFEPTKALDQWPFAWLSQTTALGITELGLDAFQGQRPPGDPPTTPRVPVVIDFQAGTLAPVWLFGLESWEPYLGRNFILSYEQANWFRVATGGECLNIRERPEASAPVRACFADNVLLKGQPKGTVTDDHGVTWGAVEGPGYVSGWAAMEYLVRR